MLVAVGVLVADGLFFRPGEPVAVEGGSAGEVEGDRGDGVRPACSTWPDGRPADAQRDARNRQGGPPREELPESRAAALAGLSQVTVTVVEEDGRPIEGICVRVVPDASEMSRDTATDAQGRAILNLKPGGYDEVSNAQGRERKDLERFVEAITVKTLEPRSLRHTLPRRDASLTVRVVDHRGQPVPGVEIGTDAAGGQARLTDIGGSVVFDKLPARELQVALCRLRDDYCVRIGGDKEREFSVRGPRSTVGRGGATSGPWPFGRRQADQLSRVLAQCSRPDRAVGDLAFDRAGASQTGMARLRVPQPAAGALPHLGGRRRKGRAVGRSRRHG
jgi:hypothetical protein